MGSSKHFREKTFCSQCIAGGSEMELQRVPVGIHCAIEIHPRSFDLDIRFVNAPRVGCFFEMWLAHTFPFVQDVKKAFLYIGELQGSLHAAEDSIAQAYVHVRRAQFLSLWKFTGESPR